ncbi:hypothetical protein GSU68_03195 [Rathayibacter sp. VKM Ac-2759]|uniref:S-layer homology domain-containing protein n=1 Tax=Rathayibacter sp. VKM Ac-2759 TaxID=2609252 RepID=UPI001318A6CA|nr:S-layer homology domain-containing protein [Rathayibacter sp. VKM Ac-2759]QHC65683.1 hypothetical protein GSU68_03195 [Rathayibacter sp. VKM Ac-2759]
MKTIDSVLRYLGWEPPERSTRSSQRQSKVSVAIAVLVGVAVVLAPSGAAFAAPAEVTAAAEEPGTITGIVTDSRSGDPLEGVSVSAFSPGVTSTVASGLSAADGRYSLQVRASAYQIQFAKSGYELAWYGAGVTETRERATVLDVVAGRTTTADQALEKIVYPYITGSVRILDKYGNPAPKGTIADINAYRCRSADPASCDVTSGRTTSLEDGSYSLRAWETGTYRVAFTGYLTGATISYTPEWFDRAPSREAATSIVLGDEETRTGVNGTLRPVDYLDQIFVDVPEAHAFYGPIQWMGDTGLSNGFPGPGGTKEYRPAIDVTREAMAAFLYRYSGVTFTPPATPSFSDVPAASEFYTAIEWMKAEGITTGNADGTYGPKDAVTRQAMAAFLGRLNKEDVSNPGPAQFSDVPSSNPFFGYVNWMKTSGLSTGYPDGTYHPLENVTRQAMAAFLYRNDLQAGSPDGNL